MNKATLIDKMAEEAGITKVTAAVAIESLVDGITTALKKQQRVTIAGFGTWSVGKRAERAGRNPQTGETIRIKAKKTVRFRPGKRLEGVLNR